MNPIPSETQVIIVGAGPAGAATSIYLTKAGIPHVIIEKETFPRDKVCGDGCSGKTAFVLRKADPSWIREIFSSPESYSPSEGIIFVAPNGRSLNIPFSSDPLSAAQAPGFTAPRFLFDHFLFRKLPSPYTTIVQQAAITSIERVAGKVTVHFEQQGQVYTVSAPLIVGADGDKGIVRKTFVGDNTSPKSHAVGLRAYYDGVKGLDKRNFIELHFLPEILPGYFWIFPLPGGRANVGVGLVAQYVRDKKINLREQMLKAIKENPNIRDRFADATLIDKIQGWGLPMSMGPQPVSGDHYLLTGDAAGLVDPFTGEGIGNAMFSGMLAAYAIERAIAEQQYNGDFLKQQYDAVLYRRIGDELKISARLQSLCRYPWLFNFVVNKAAKSPTLGKTISAMMTNVDLRDQLRKPSFYAKILFNR